MSAFRLGAACLVVLAAAGCDVFDSDSEVGDLVLSVTAEGIRLTTEDEYLCSNFVIDIDAAVDATEAVIVVEGLEETDLCATAPGPADVFVLFAEGTQPIEYGIAIEKDGRTDRFDYTCGFAGCSLTPIGTPSFTRIAS